MATHNASNVRNISNVRTLFVCALTTMLTAGAVVSGCNDDTVAPKPVEAGATCPASFDGANGQKCGVEGENCTFEYYCEGNLYQIANCGCTAGKFVCFDQAAPQTPIPVGSEPQCLQGNPKPDVCPTNFASADGQSCKVPGGICYYPGQFCGGIAQIDHCQCVSGGNGSATDGGTLAYKCERDICNLEAGVGSTTDASFDSSFDASFDAD